MDGPPLRFAFWAVLSMALAFSGGRLAAESKAKPDPALQDALSRGRVAFRQGDLVEARKEFEGVLRASPEEPMAVEYMGKIDREFRGRVEKLLKAARKARLAADEDLAEVLDGQPNDAEGMKRLFEAVGGAAKAEKVPLADLEWFMARPSTAPFSGARAEKQGKLRSHVKGKN